MLIHEAVGKALACNGGLCRSTWMFQMKLMPNDARDTISGKCENRPPFRSWNPTPEDLMADDWIVTEEEAE